MPCIKAYIVVGPTNLNPLARISLLRFFASFEVVGTSSILLYAWCIVLPLVNCQRYFAKDPYSFLISRIFCAFCIAASIFLLLRIIPELPIRRRTSPLLNPAIFTGLKFANAFLKLFFFESIIAQLKPAWNVSRKKAWSIFLSSTRGLPHSVSWYSVISRFPNAHGHLARSITEYLPAILACCSL